MVPDDQGEGAGVETAARGGGVFLTGAFTGS